MAPPKLPEPRYKVVCCRISEKTDTKLRELIKRRRLKVSDIVNTALVAYLEAKHG